MKALRIVFRLGLLIGSALAIPCSPMIAQTASSKESLPQAPALQTLAGDDARRAAELDKAVETAQKADRWDEAITKANELFALRTRIQGPKHFETVSADWNLRTLRLVAPMVREDRVAYQSSKAMNEQVETLEAQGKYAEAQPLCEKALVIRRRLLTDDHPDTTESYLNLAFCFNALGKYSEATTLLEKTLEIRRRLLTDEHPRTAACYNGLAVTLGNQGKYAQAQPLYDKALSIQRRLLTDDHRQTARTYMNLAFCLNAQGKYAEAQPLYEKALEISRRLLGDDHADTAYVYHNLAANLGYQGKYVQAQPLIEKAVDIRHRLLTDDHPSTARSIDNLAMNLNAQGKYAEAQPLYEKALQLRRRLLTDDHPETAASYDGVASCLSAGGKYAEAQPLYEKALELRRRLLTDNHPHTARGYYNLANDLAAQGKYAEAQPLYEKALELRRRLLTDAHAATANTLHRLASNLNAQGKYLEARDRWQTAVKSLDQARLEVAFTGLERARSGDSIRPALAGVLARLGQPAEAWQALEEDLGRGLLDELAAREDRRLTPAERSRLRELTAELERLDKLVESTPKGLDQAERAARFEELKRKRVLAGIALGEFQTKLVHDYGPLAGQVASLQEVQAALPADAALVAWVDITSTGPNAADPDGEHWGVVVRNKGIPTWAPIAGTGSDRRWTKDDVGLAGRARLELRRRPARGTEGTRPVVERLRTQRLEPLAKALGVTADGQPAARTLIILPSRAMEGVPIEALLETDDFRTVSYTPSATVFKYLRVQPRPDRHAGLLALGDPIYERPDTSSEPKPLPDHGLLVNVVVPGANAATHGLKPGDVLLAYDGQALNKKDDLKVVAEGNKPIAIEIWRDGRSSRRDLSPGKIGVVFDRRPAPAALTEQRELQQAIVAARGGGEGFDPLPGTRYEVEALARLFRSDDRPTRALLGADASEPELDRLAAAGELRRFGFIHLATHGVIDDDMPARSAVVLTQSGLPDPLEQVLHQKPAFDGRLSAREIQRGWDLKAELVTLSACETALGRDGGGEGFVGFTQALLMSGTRSACLSLWKVDDTATALLMQRFYANLLGRRLGLLGPMPKAEALREAKAWLRTLRRADVLALTADLSGGVERGKGAKSRQPVDLAAAVPAGADDDRTYASPHFWAAFVLAGDPD